MLTEEERRKIEKSLHQYPAKQNACIDALKIVQKNRGWVSDEAVKDIAEFLEISVSEVDSVATFYNLIYRKPVGKNVILLCDSVSCWIMGYETVYEHLRKRLDISFGETTPDERFTLLPIPCLGVCDRAPAMMINEDLYTELSAQKINEILKEYEN